MVNPALQRYDSFETTEDFDESQVIERAQHGDHLAFGLLVRDTFQKTYSLAFRITQNADDAMDVVQESYLRAFKSLSKFRKDSSFSTWMFRITVNCAASYIKKARKHDCEELGDSMELQDRNISNDPEHRASFSYEVERLSAALSRLSPDYRSVIVLKDVYGLSHEAISKELKITKSSAKVRLHRARACLKEEYFSKSKPSKNGKLR